MSTVCLASGNERLISLECPADALPPVVPPALLQNEFMCDVLKASVQTLLQPSSRSSKLGVSHGASAQCVQFTVSVGDNAESCSALFVHHMYGATEVNKRR